MQIFIQSLAEKFRGFSDFSANEDKFALFSVPFSFNAATADENIQMELIEMQSHSVPEQSTMKLDHQAFIPTFLNNAPASGTLLRELCSVWFDIC